jgi:hypothetical protein
MLHRFKDVVMPVLDLDHASKDANRARLERCILDVSADMRAA